MTLYNYTVYPGWGLFTNDVMRQRGGGRKSKTTGDYGLQGGFGVRQRTFVPLKIVAGFFLLHYFKRYLEPMISLFEWSFKKSETQAS